jgi:hypothetical protein
MIKGLLQRLVQRQLLRVLTLARLERLPEALCLLNHLQGVCLRLESSIPSAVTTTQRARATHRTLTTLAAPSRLPTRAACNSPTYTQLTPQSLGWQAVVVPRVLRAGLRRLIQCIALTLGERAKRGASSTLSMHTSLRPNALAGLPSGIL